MSVKQGTIAGAEFEDLKAEFDGSFESDSVDADDTEPMTTGSGNICCI